MANLEAIKADANKNAATLVRYLRDAGLIGETINDTLRDYASEQEEVLYGDCVAANDLAKRIATL